MDKKTIIKFYAAMVLPLLCTGCSSIRKLNASDGDVLSYQREIARLESSIERYNDEIGNSVEELGRIRERAFGVEGTIDEIIYLFDEYQQGVERLLQRYRKLQEDVGNSDDSSNISSNLYDN